MKSFTMRNISIGLLIISILTIIPFLGLWDYHTKGEPRESIVSYSMIDSGNWILPLNSGGEPAYKPPFFHWSIAAISMLNGGEVTEMTSRIPSAIALIALVFFGFRFFAPRSRKNVALLAAFITLTNFELHRAGMNCRVDMVLTALTVGALYSLYKWYENGLRGVPWIAIILMSLGTLTKGPVGSLVPCLVMGVFLLLRGVKFFRAFLLMCAWGSLSLIIPLFWYAAAYKQGGEEFLSLVIEENFGRMTNTMSYDSCVNPWYYNIVTLVSGYFPWTLLILFSLFSLSWNKMKGAWKPSDWWGQLKEKIAQMKPVNLFAATSIIIIFIFYCFPQSKRSVYLMPIYPFIAYFMAKYMLFLMEKKSKAIKIYGGVLATMALILPLCFLVVKIGLIPDSIFGGKRAQQNISMMHALGDAGGVLTWSMIAIPTIIAIFWLIYHHKRAVNANSLLVLVFLHVGIFLSLDGAYQPPILNAKSVKGVAKEIDQIAPEKDGSLYEFIAEGVFAKGDPIHFFEINFYLKNRIGDFYKDRPKAGFLLIPAGDAENYLTEFEREGYSFEKCYTSPKRVIRDLAEVYKFKKED